jgi:hypothetical protein
VRTASIAGNHNEIDASGLIGNRSTLLPIAGLFRARLGMSFPARKLVGQKMLTTNP